jgi:hypothetical protein
LQEEIIRNDHVLSIFLQDLIQNRNLEESTFQRRRFNTQGVVVREPDNVMERDLTENGGNAADQSIHSAAPPSQAVKEAINGSDIAEDASTIAEEPVRRKKDRKRPKKRKTKKASGNADDGDASPITNLPSDTPAGTPASPTLQEDSRVEAPAPEILKAEEPKPETSKPEMSKAEQKKPEMSKPDSSNSEPQTPQPSNPEPPKTGLSRFARKRVAKKAAKADNADGGATSSAANLHSGTHASSSVVEESRVESPQPVPSQHASAESASANIESAKPASDMRTSSKPAPATPASIKPALPKTAFLTPALPKAASLKPALPKAASLTPASPKAALPKPEASTAESSKAELLEHGPWYLTLDDNVREVEGALSVIQPKSSEKPDQPQQAPDNTPAAGRAPDIRQGPATDPQRGSSDQYGQDVHPVCAKHYSYSIAPN